MTRLPGRLVLLGHPVSHSLSPAFQNAALRHAALPIPYELLDVTPAALDTTLDALVAEGAWGNVTIPHKQHVASRCARVSALAERVKLLEGLPMDRAKELASRFDLTPGAERFVKMLKSLGYRVGLVSGGFDFFVEQLKTRFGLDFAFSNELEEQNGVLTGRVQGSIVDGER